MKKLHIGTICASVFAFSLLFSAPTFADNSSIHDNGTTANNTIEVSQEHQVDIAQQNDTQISNDVSVNNNTGNNTVSGSSRGNVDINSGDADATVTINNTAGLNQATVSNQDANQNRFDIYGNGYRSSNRIDYSAQHNLNVDQTNRTNIDNTVDVSNNTGNNTASGNRGNTSIQTGDADATVDISNTAGANFLNVNGNGSNNTDARITDNGGRSYNMIDFMLNHNTTVNQQNSSHINNSVDVSNNTGNNSVRGDHSDYDNSDSYNHNHDNEIHHDYDNGNDHNRKYSDDRNHEDNCDKNNNTSNYNQSHRDTDWMRYSNDQRDREHCDSYKPSAHWMDGKGCDCNPKQSYNNDHARYGNATHAAYEPWKHTKNAEQSNYNACNTSFHSRPSWMNQYEGMNYSHKNNYNSHNDRNSGGMGSVSIRTGNANATISLNNTESSNWLSL